jgi:hypothetical protein
MLALALLALTAAPAAASSVSLDVGGSRTALGKRLDGTLLYQTWYGSQVVLQGVALNDAGSPVPGGTLVHLTMQTHPGDPIEPITDVATAADGSFSLPIVPDHGRRYLAHVDAAAGVTAADANSVRIYVAPALRLTMPLAQRGTRYRISGRLPVPSPRQAGLIVVSRCSDAGFAHCHRFASLRMRADGTWRTSVVHATHGRYRYAIVFAPADRVVWASSKLHLTVNFK